MKNNRGKSIRIFKNPILESFTHVHPVVPLVLWVPVILFFYLRGILFKNVNALEFAMLFLAGILLWTLTEYILHRFVFHWNAQSRAGRYFVYLFHGLHHDNPSDPSRLVMPPVPAILIVSLLWLLFRVFVPMKYLDVFMGHFLAGYLCYDYIHYATHHFKMTSKIGKFLRKYHLQHHYTHELGKFGVSSPLWDYIFNTYESSEDHIKK